MGCNTLQKNLDSYCFKSSVLKRAFFFQFSTTYKEYRDL